MNTKQAAKKWGCTSKTVCNYCKTGIIPDAEKKVFWIIPDTQQKPPASRLKLVKVLEYIKNCSAFPKHKFAHPLSEELFVECVTYLQEYGFISKMNNISIDGDWTDIVVSNIGEELIKSEKIKHVTNKKVTVSASAGPTGLSTVAVTLESSPRSE